MTERTQFARLAAPGVRGLRPYEPGKPLAELEREYGITNSVKLASNENPLGPSAQAVGAARASCADVARYPDGNGFLLKRVLAERHGVEPAQVTLGNGSNDVLELVTRAFVTPDHEVVFSEHAFAVYALATQAVGAEAVQVSACRPDSTGGLRYGHDLDAMLAAVTPMTRLVFVANPNNPTGTWLGDSELEQFVAGLPPHVLVVVDEAYFEYAVDLLGPEAYANCVPWVERYPNLIVTRTFSKAYGLAGLRVGYAVSHPDVADLLNRVRQPFNVNSLALAAAEAALADDDHITRTLQLNREGNKMLTDGFSAKGLDWIPSAGNFLSVDVRRSGADVYAALLDQGVIVRPVANYGLPQHLRVTIGLPDENARFLAALERVL